MIQLFQDLEDLVSLIAVESCIILNQSGCFACCLEDTLMGWSPSPVFTVLLIPTVQISHDGKFNWRKMFQSPTQYNPDQATPPPK